MLNCDSGIKHVCFDLDGTIMDSYATIYKTTIRTLEYLGITDHLEEKEFHKRIGLHFLDIFNDLKVSVPDIEHFINVYKSFYFSFINESVIYPNAHELFDFLTSGGIKISLLTTKAQDQADKILEHFSLSKYFSHIMGRRIGLEIKPSPIPLLNICSTLNVRPSETLMVGDSELDVRCGKAAGTKTCAVTIGYRTRELLELEKPDYIASGLKEIIHFV
jgi:HAD superfamily hydrolase (TIGR01549 family)